MHETLVQAQSMLDQYLSAIRHTKDLLDEQFAEAVQHVANLPSILVVTGLGKSGLIAQKAAATLSSTGTRSVFVHPVEALHGDLGVVSKDSSLLALSKSGRNQETIDFADQFRQVTHGRVISLSESDSPLAHVSDIAIAIPKLPEIDSWDLAPTTSSLTSLAICDILAICVQKAKNFTAKDFAQYHPSGALGKRLLLDVDDFMVSGDALPCLDKRASFSSVIYAISSKGFGLVLLTETDGTYIGMLTDGDIRRLLERDAPITSMNGWECFQASRRQSTESPVKQGWVTGGTKAIECLRLMEEAKITSLVILEQDKPKGLVRMQDLVAAGL